MTVPNENTETQAVLTALGQTIATTFTFREAGELKVTKTPQDGSADVLLVLNSNYSVTLPAQVGQFGSVTLEDDAAIVGDTITIEFAAPCDQQTDLEENDRLPANVLEITYDKVYQLVCKVSNSIFGPTSRVLKYPDTELGTPNTTPSKADRMAGGNGTIAAFRGSDGGIDVISKGSVLPGLTLSNDSSMGGGSPDAVNGATQAAINTFVTNLINSVEDKIELPVNEVSHTRSVGEVVRVDGSFNIVLAQADTVANAQAIGIISEIIDSDNYRIKTGGGEVNIPAHGFAAGPLYLSDTVAGGLTSTAPGIKNQIAQVKNANTIIVTDTITLTEEDQSGLPENLQLITASGNFLVPAGVTKIRVKAVAGGGGGGGASSNGGAPFGGNPGTGTSGGAGETREGIFSVTPGQNIAITIGAGGAGGAGNAAGAGSNGSPGGNTIIGAPVNMTANGGSNGTATGGAGTGGSGGSGGSYSITGENGHSGHVGAAPTIPQTERPKSGFPTHGLGGNGSAGGGFFGWNAGGGAGGNGAVLITW